MPNQVTLQRCFDARPDLVDFRDRPYIPLLASLPSQFPSPKSVGSNFSDYTRVHKLILNQGQEGACAGFGLAAVINYLLYRKYKVAEQDDGFPHHVHDVYTPSCDKPYRLTTVSPRMLYQMARIYDGWSDEEHEGASCRGAMKGWHRHGACSKKLWPYRKKFMPPGKGWQQDAATRPLGAYYRVNNDSIADMQTAIYEVGAIYVSAKVHGGWHLGSSSTLPVISMQSGETSGHAFAMVGYTADGFIVQNSWGPEWGYLGFAILTYADWVRHGLDAWVAVLGAAITQPQDPDDGSGTPRTRSSFSLQERVSGHVEWERPSLSASTAINANAAQPFSEGTAYEHTVVLGNYGRPLNRFLDVADATAAVQEVAFTLPQAWLTGKEKPIIAIYAHGGLNNEAASIKQTRVMAPYFMANDIYPLFVTLERGFGESIAGILEDAVGEFFKPSAEFPARSWDDIANTLKEAKDRSVELACENLLVKPVWRQMKYNAASSAAREGGLDLLALYLAELKKKIPALEIHLVGHSAGSILLGHLLDCLTSKKLAVQTVSLYAPACTVAFALKFYRPAIKKDIVSKERIFLDILSDECEQADTVGPYGMSLLYLVSRALEDCHKMPILGMEAAWNPDMLGEDRWNRQTRGDVEKWQSFMGGRQQVTIHGKERAMVSDGQELIRLAHGSFDNDIQVVDQTIQRIRGVKLKVAVKNLKYFSSSSKT